MNLLLISPAEAALRRAKVAAAMARHGVDAILVASNANLFYLTGRIIAGYVLVRADGSASYFVRRPVGLDSADGDVHYIRKPEQIAELCSPLHGRIALELDTIAYSTAMRLAAVFGSEAPLNASPVLAEARTVKTPCEIEMIAACGRSHDHVYRLIPSLYRPGMSDIELHIAIEEELRRQGCLGLLRVAGDSMEIHTGNLLVGDNADTPSPYDFSLGGAGASPALPVGADGTIIRPGETVMADMNGNFNGYMTDMSRTFVLGQAPEKALRAHQCSIDICHRLAAEARPGMECRELYDMAMELVAEADLADYYMGHRQKAAFIGHGVGIEINELPVVTARSRQPLEAGQVIALEPKFVIPGVGAVGIENTYLVETDGGLTSFNHALEQLLPLD